MSTQTALKQTIQAPVEAVYQAFSTATWLCEWFGFDAQLEFVPGGRFYAYWRPEAYYLMGEYTELRPNQQISIRFHSKDDPEPNTVHIYFSGNSQQTEVRVEHERAVPEGLLQLWEKALVNLESTATTGYQAELRTRPMMGVLLGGNISAENAAQYKLPLDYGVIISGTLPGLSGEAAGLQRNDVLVSLAGQEVRDIPAIGRVLSGYKAGDTIQARYYREGQVYSVDMELKPRRFRPFPASVSELAQQMVAEKNQLVLELDQLMQGVSEAQAAHKAAPERWSANEVIAHLINTERETQTQIAALVVGTEVEVFTANMEAKVQAIARRYRSSKALAQALKDTYLETLELIRALPESFLSHKASVARIQLNAEADPLHVRHHFGQIQRAIETAKAAVASS